MSSDETQEKETETDEWPFKTARFDPRFPNTNQTKHCWVMYVDFYRCTTKLGEGYAPCDYFKKAFTSLCPFAWVEKWDQQRADGIFPVDFGTPKEAKGANGNGESAKDGNGGNGANGTKEECQ